MNAKHLFAWAAACPLFACPILASAQGVTLYGNFDEYIGYVRSSSGAHITGLNDGAILRSRLGVRGSEDLGDGLKLKYNLEMGFAADSGAAADSSGNDNNSSSSSNNSDSDSDNSDKLE